jgi:hypothetical protein
MVLGPAARAVVVACALVAMSAGVARAAPLPTGSAPLPGSSFQGADGDQDDQAPYVDWQGLQATGRVTHSPDPNAADSAFVGGSQEDEPGEWDLTTEPGGVSPAKSNILDAWSVVDQPAADTFLYLGFTREAAGGTTYVAFELNQDARLWNNGRAEIPCRRTGDVLVVLAAHGNDVEMVLERWTTTATNAATGCATRGSLTRVTSVASADAQGVANSGAIASRLPGSFAPGSTVAAGLFGEAALRLNALIEHAFDDQCFNFASIWMHSRSSLSEPSNLQDYVMPRPLAVRTCSASGTKFLDLNANGARDEGEPGIPRFVVWADYDDDGVRDADEPYSVTDDRGDYVVHDIRPPNGTYRLRETLLAADRLQDTSWVCSSPHDGTPGGFGDGSGGLFGCGWGPIATATTPYAQGRDFGNWLPAELTIEKQLWPADDPGRFDLAVNGVTVLPAAGDGATTTIALRPGSYDITEVAVPPTNAADYRSTATCRATTRRRGRVRTGAGYTGLVLHAGARATCTFINVRPGVPAIAIQKAGPTVATAGDTLHYRLYVSNPGDRAFPASSVEVRDPACDEAPELVTKGGDDSPDTLDPGDTWTYGCSRNTPAPEGDCTVSTVANRATVTATADGTAVTDDDEILTTLNCPDEPPQPPLPTPTPGPTPSIPPGPSPVTGAAVAPPGPRPPAAGRIGIAGLRVGGGCVRTTADVRLIGTRMARIAVSVNGRRVSNRRLAILQRRATPLRRLFSAGRHRVVVRVTFQRGSGAPAVTLRRTITVCGPARPSFAG